MHLYLYLIENGVVVFEFSEKVYLTPALKRETFHKILKLFFRGLQPCIKLK